MNGEFQYFLDALNFKFGYAIGFTTWSTGLRLVMVFVNDKIREFMESLLPAEREGLQKFLNSVWWRGLVFAVNALTSIKLPGQAKKVTGDTTQINKPTT